MMTDPTAVDASCTAVLVVQISTIAGWSSIFYRTWDSTGVWCLAYHLSIIVFVAYILVNCFLAGLKLKFASASHDAFSQETTEQAQSKVCTASV